jgi:signal transduction histidine kinase/DNA-binding response OmpR family regulator
MRSTVLVQPLSDEHDSTQARLLTRDLGQIVGLSLHDHTLFASAVSEIARNAVQHGKGGEIEFAIQQSDNRGYFIVIVRDHGPGISSVEPVQKKRSGQGLEIAKRLTDTLEIESSAETGTIVTLTKALPVGVRPTPEAIALWREAIADNSRISTTEVLRQQNRELIATIEALRKSDAELHARMETIDKLNQELARSNNDLRLRGEELEVARQDAEDAARSKASFLATMSHEIRTPLNAIIGMSGLLIDTELNTQQKEFAETVRVSSEYLLGLINDILDFSKFEAGKLELERHAFDLRSCVEDSLDLVAASANAKRLELAYKLDGRLPAYFYGDTGRFRQVLVNLLSNAVKFTAAGEVIAEISGERLDMQSIEARYELEVAVHDTGIGIRDDQRDRLFKSFSQADASTTRQYGGTGLGLAICKRIVDAMNGRIWHENRSDRGSSFRFRIPLEKARPSEVPSSKVHAPPGALLGMHALIVDDNHTNLRILALQCDSFGMTHADTDSSLEALRWIREGRRFDIAILDHCMPELDGLELAVEIRKSRDPRALKIVILTSAGPMQNSVRDAGVDIQGCFCKPLHLSRFYDALVSTLGSPPAGLARKSDQIDQAVGAISKPLRILLAEDNLVNQRVALLMLEKLHLKADAVANGVEALEAISNVPYDVILMDVLMPEMDGLEATRRVREQLPRDRQPRIIAMTANAMAGDRERCLEAGMDDYVSKPVRIEDLARALQDCSSQQPVAEPVPITEARDDRFAPLKEAVAKLVAATGPSGARQVLETLAHDAPTMLSGLRDALARNDAAEVRRFSHSMRSNSMMVGASTIAGLMLSIERQAAENHLDQLATLVADALSEYEQLANNLLALSRSLADN